jgi:hypothetical protein
MEKKRDFTRLREMIKYRNRYGFKAKDDAVEAPRSIV